MSSSLGCARPDIVPRATRHIPEMVDLIERLLQKNHAYKSDGSIYYRITSFPDYGKLSKINFAGNIVGGILIASPAERAQSARSFFM